MGRAVEMGVLAGSDRHLYSLPLGSFAEWPDELPLASRHFVLFIAGGARGTADRVILQTARRALDQGLAYLCAWGPDCRRVESRFDQAIIARNPEEHADSVVMTTSHAEESLEDAARFFLNAAWPAAAYEATCRSRVAAAVGSEPSIEALRRVLGRSQGGGPDG